MRRAFVLLVLGLIVSVGCGRSEVSSSGAGDDSAVVSQTVFEPAALSSAAMEHPATQSTQRFLDAMLQGDQSTLLSLLTPTARVRGREKGMPFCVQASPTARYVVRDTHLKDELGAFVQTELIELDESGRPATTDILWIVAKTEEGWRIAGAAVTLFEGQEKTIINFEDPEATLHALAQAENMEMQRRSQYRKGPK